MRGIRTMASFVAGAIVMALILTTAFLILLDLFPALRTDFGTAHADVRALAIKSERYYCRSNLFSDLAYCLSDRAYAQEQDDPEGFTDWQECGRSSRNAYRDCLDAIERSDYRD